MILEATTSSKDLVVTYETPFWGVMVSVSLIGITVMQAWKYFNAEYNEWILRTLVAVIVMLDFANVIIDAMALRYYFLENFGNADAFLSLPSYMSIESIITAIIVFLVQLFFASRVYLLTYKNWFATAFVFGTATCAFVAGLLKSINTLYHPLIENFTSKSMMIEVILRAVSAALCDVSVTTILYRTLRQSQQSTTIKSTRNVLQRLLVFVMTRGILVSVTQTVLLILYAFNAEKMYWSILHFCLTRVYVISMLSMLNARQDLQRELYRDPGTNDLRTSYLGSSSVASMRAPTFLLSSGDLELGTLTATASKLHSSSRTNASS